MEKLHPFLLPHEWLAKAQLLCDLDGLKADPITHKGIFSHIAKIAQGLGSPPSSYLPLGLHCDGLPFGSQIFYSDSLELFNLNFPCGDQGMRIPFTSVQKKHLVKHATYNAIMEVLAWSLQKLAAGIFPEARHDGTAFGPGETARKNLATHCQPVRALLVEMRADWAALKQVFQFPQQNENSGICWLCYATPSNFKDTSRTATWRQLRRTAVSWHLELARAGKNCPLWSVPGVSSEIVIIDWLHCADLGIAADIMGNVLLELVGLMPGGPAESKANQIKTLWCDLQKDYDGFGNTKGSQVSWFENEPFYAAKKITKAEGKAAHIRYFVPVLDRCVQSISFECL